MKSKIAQNKASLKHNNELRLKAIVKLGGMCKCGDNRVDKLMIMAIGVNKGLSQQVLYRRVIIAIDKVDNIDEIARLLCKDCWSNERNQVARARVYNKQAKPLTSRNGEYHWIAGQRVLKPKGYQDT